MQSPFLKKFLILLGAATTVSLVSTSNLRAQGASEEYLRQIAQNTNNILQKVNNLPAYLSNLAQMALAFTAADNSNATANTQLNFTKLNNLINKNSTTQLSLQTQLNGELFKNADPIETMVPYANDLTYSTILGSPYLKPDPREKASGKNQPPAQDAAINYVKNASGISLFHFMPGIGWKGSAVDQKRYFGYYNTVMAVESFNGYILSNQYADGNQTNTLQQTLINQASDPKNWFAQIASENIGYVLRQLLLYQSQVFVLLTQLVQTQKQMLNAQAMTNAVLIASNTQQEAYLAGKAQGAL